MNEIVLAIGIDDSECTYLCSDCIDAAHAAVPVNIFHSFRFVRNCGQIYANKKLACVQK